MEITYVDYSVARAFLAAIDEWFRTIPRSPDNRFMVRLQTFSHWIPRVFRLATAIVLTLIAVGVLPQFVGSGQQSLLEFGRFFMLAGLGIHVAYRLAGWSSDVVELAIDRWSTISYININRGDSIEIDNVTRSNRRHLLMGIFGVVGTVGLDVAAKIIADVISKFWQ